MSAATLIDNAQNSSLSLGSFGTEVTPLPQASASNAERPTLVIGDIHGHLTRFENLLLQEGIIGTCPECMGFGDFPATEPGDGDKRMCTACHGDGICRINRKVRVVLVGDIGHFGKGGSPTGDMLTWLYATRWADTILWGNHDRAVFENAHHHSGFEPPMVDTYKIMRDATDSGQLLLATVAHGFVITHAGIHSAFRDNKIDDVYKTDPEAFANWVNQLADPFDVADDRNLAGVVDSIPRKRGGFAHAGGILWRDIDEKLYPGFRQIFGHSADYKERSVRYCWEKMYSRKAFPKLEPPVGYCIDIGGISDAKGSSENCLAGIWLPDERIVEWRG